MTSAVASYDEAIDYILGRINYERVAATSYSASDFKLDRMARLLDALGNPQRSIPAVHITGTKGKGSTASMTASILSAAGNRVGLFTSPHILRFEERMQVAGRSPQPDELVALVNEIAPVVERLIRTAPELTPTFFEMTTALAWLYFQSKSAEIVVLEVGLGGRLDSTNLCRPEVTVITNVSLDHTQILGDTHAAIAREKAGIVKPGVPLISGVRHPEALAVVRDTCRTQEAPLIQIDEGFSLHIRETNTVAMTRRPFSSERFQVVTAEKTWDNLTTPLLGRHQQHNAALAVLAANCLTQRGWDIGDDAIALGLAKVTCPLRVEVVSERPTVILDVAHNPASITALIDTIKDLEIAGKRILVFAATRDKDVRRMLELVDPQFDDIILTQYVNNPRSVPYDELAAIYETVGRKQPHVVATPPAAWKLARESAGQDDLVCITGSFFLAAEVRDTILHTEERTTAEPNGAPHLANV